MRSTARRAPKKPANVARRSGAIEIPVRESTDSRIILSSGYFVDPAARSSRLYCTVSDGKPRAGTMNRSTRLCSGRLLIASTVARDMSRKSPASACADVPRHEADEPVERLGRDALEPRVRGPVVAHAVDDVDAVVPGCLEHLRDDLRRVLEVGVERHDVVAEGARRDRRRWRPGGRRWPAGAARAGPATPGGSGGAAPASGPDCRRRPRPPRRSLPCRRGGAATARRAMAARPPRCTWG